MTTGTLRWEMVITLCVIFLPCIWYVEIGTWFLGALTIFSAKFIKFIFLYNILYTIEREGAREVYLSLRILGLF